MSDERIAHVIPNNEQAEFTENGETLENNVNEDCQNTAGEEGCTKEQSLWNEETEFYDKLFYKLADIRETSLATQKELLDLGFQAATCLSSIKLSLAKYKIYNLLLSEESEKLVDLPQASVAESPNKSVAGKLILEDIKM